MGIRTNCVLLLIIWLHSTSVAAEPNQPVLDRFEMALTNSKDYVAIMSMLEASLQANYEKLATWEGAYKLEEGVVVPSLPQAIKRDGKKRVGPRIITDGNFWMERSLVVQFEINFQKNQVYSTFETTGPIVIIDRSTGDRTARRDLAQRVRHVLTPDNWLRSDLPLNDDGRGRGPGINTGVRLSAGNAKPFLDYSYFVDPRSFFEYSGNSTFANFLHRAVGALKDGTEVALEIRETKDDSSVKYTLFNELRYDPKDKQEVPSIAETVFDSAVGFNPVLMIDRNENGLIEQRREWEYKQFSGIWLPSRVTMKKFKRGSAELLADRKFELLDTKVNMSIDQDDFSWNRLGLIDGDQIRDEIRGLTYRYHKGTLVPADQYSDKGNNKKTSPAPVVEQSGGNKLFLIANIGVLVLIVILIALRHYRLTNKEKPLAKAGRD